MKNSLITVSWQVNQQHNYIFYYFLVESTLVESTATAAESVALAAVSTVAAAESVLASVEAPPHAAKAAIAKIANTFFIRKCF
jgi:hypothetical protein